MRLGEWRKNKKWLAMLAAGLIVAAVAGVLFWRGSHARELFERGMTAIRDAGPWAFFGAMALLPALGMPMLAFTIPAGAAFTPTLGAGGVVAAALAALTFNLVLSYCLARWLLRPGLTRLLERLGYRLPQVATADLTDLIVLLRVTPGIPFFAQNYLLGLARAPLGRYLAISCGIQGAYTVIVVLFGEALLHGKAKVGMAAVGMLIALGTVIHLVRRHYAGKKAAA